MIIPPCPNCGSTWTQIKGTWHGPGSRIYGDDGTIEETSSDNLYFESTYKVIRCYVCEKIRHDLKYEDGEIVVIK